MSLFSKISNGIKQSDSTNDLLLDYETSIARIVLSCIDELPFSVGVSKVAQILMGHQTIFLTEYKFMNNSMFGKLQQFSKLELTYIIKMLAIHRYVIVHEELDVFEVVNVSPKGYSVLNGRRKLDTITETQTVEIDDNDIPLINALKELRMELAIKNNMKAFEICDDVTLIKIAQDKPTTISELESVNYLDFEFVEKYGTVVIKCLSNNVVIT